jgi:hypothetical protein
MLKDPAGAAVWGMLVEVDLTPPVRRPARRDARGVGAVGMIEINMNRKYLVGEVGTAVWSEGCESKQVRMIAYIGRWVADKRKKDYRDLSRNGCDCYFF